MQNDSRGQVKLTSITGMQSILPQPTYMKTLGLQVLALGITASVLTVTANSLRVKVPNGATYRPLYVTTGGLTASFGRVKKPFKGCELM